MSIHRVFTLFLLLINANFAEAQTNINRVIPNNVFSQTKQIKTTFNDLRFESIYFSTLMPKKIVIEQLESFYGELGSFEKEKKVYNSSIQTKGELLSLVTTIVKKEKRVFIYISDKEDLKKQASINNLQESFKKILMRKFVNDYINELEKNIKKIDKKQNKIIRNNPNNLLMNSAFFYKIYQKKESKKVGLKSALETLYEELEDTKKIYNSIK
tara:strand:+ start:1531 stop:2169 length:639 start_codon:yes stop_codon:yes gene_type:complete